MSGESYDFGQAILFNVEEHLRRLRREQTKTDEVRKVTQQQASEPAFNLWVRRLTEDLGAFSKLHAVRVHSHPLMDDDLGSFIKAQTKNVSTHTLLFVTLKDHERLTLHMIHGQRYVKLGVFKVKAFGSEFVWEEEVRGIKKLILEGRVAARR